MITEKELLANSATYTNPRDNRRYSRGYFGELDLGIDWAYVITVNRDSGILDRSNWDVISQDLENKYPDFVTIERWNHWACGWIDYLAVRMINDDGSYSDAGAAAVDWLNALERYPVADDEHHSAMQYDSALECLKWMEPSDLTARAPKSADYRLSKAYHLLSERHNYIEVDDHGTILNIDDDDVLELYQDLRWAYKTQR